MGEHSRALLGPYRNGLFGSWVLWIYMSFGCFVNMLHIAFPSKYIQCIMNRKHF